MTTKTPELEIEIKAEIIQPKFEIKKINPTEIELRKKANEYSKLLEINIETKEQFELVSTARKDCKATRVEIAKIAKEIRDEATKFSKAVIAQEKELLAIISPFEASLSAKEDAYLAAQEYEKRKKRFPSFRDKFKQELNYDLTEDEFCSKDDAAIHALEQKIKFEKLEKERLDLEAKQAEQRAKEEALAAQERELQKQKQALENEKAIKLAADKAAQDAQAEAERKHKLELEEMKADTQRKLKEQQEAATREAAKKKMQEQLEAANKEREIKEAQAKQEFMNWTKDIGFNPDTDILQFDQETQTHKAFRLIATFKQPQETKEIEI